MTTDERLDAVSAQLAQCLRGIALLVKHLGAAPTQQPQATTQWTATDAELGGQYGNPEVKKDPPRWKGGSHVGLNLSHCSPEFLDCFADFKDYCAAGDREQWARMPDGTDEEFKAKANKAKYAGYAEKDAALARGWAKRLRGRPAEEL